MILLDTTTRKLELLLGGTVTTNQLPFVASYVDLTTTTFTPASNAGQTNNASAVTLVDVPASSTQRQLKFLSIYNADTAAATVTIRLNDNSTLRKIFVTTLAVGDTLLYADGGWSAIDTNGKLKTSGSGGGANVDDTAFGSSWNANATDAPSKNAVYDWAHTFDTDDDGKVNVLDMGAGIVKTDAGGAVSAASAGTDYLAPISTPTNTDIVTTNGSGVPQDSGKQFDTDGTLAADSDAKIATQKAVKTYADALALAAGAPTNAHYVTTQAESGLSNEANLGALTTGLLKHSVSAGVSTPATATAGTDYADNAFKTIAVSGQSDVVADSAADTLTLAAGTNVTITTNASTDTVTIAASGVGGSGTTSQVSGSNFTTTSATLVDVTGLTFAASANTKYEVNVLLACQSSDANGLKVAIAFSAAGATGAFNSLGAVSGGASTSGNVFGTADPIAYLNFANTTATVEIRAIVVVGANTGNITTQVLKVSAGTATVYIGSRMTVTQL